MINIESLNSECFTYELYESNWWELFGIDYIDSMYTSFIRKLINKYAVGYCDASKLTVRPKSSGYAVMFERNKNRFWFHIEEWELEDIK